MSASEDESVGPWQETWAAIFPYEDPDGGTWEIVHAGTEVLVGDITYEAPAKLAAQAPAMARLLMEYLAEGSIDPSAVRRVLDAAGVP